MADKLTPADLQQMKIDGRKIACAVVYEAQMTRLCERAGAELLSVGDSLGRGLLAHANSDEFTIDEMLVLASAVVRAAKRAVVNVDMPGSTTARGIAAIQAAAKRIKHEAGADMTKVDIRGAEEALLDTVPAVIEAGLSAYPQIGYSTQSPNAGRRTDAASHDHVLKWAHAVADAGAAAVDLTNVSHEIYADVTKSLHIPVIGGQTGPEADGHIYVMYGLVGYRVEALDADDGRPTVGRLVYDIAKKAFDEIHAGSLQGR